MKSRLIVVWTALLLSTPLALSAPLAAENTEAEKDGGQPLAREASLPLEALQVFTEVFGTIKSEYVDKADDGTLLRDAVHGMINGLDPHSAFLDAEAFTEMRLSDQGKFGGIGVEISVEDGFIRVITPLDDTPAHRAGIQSGDSILMLDGVTLRGMSLRDATQRLRGPPGSEVVLTISRGDRHPRGDPRGEGEAFEVPVVRDVIEVSSVKSEMLEEDFGYVRIAGFLSGTGAGLGTAIDQLEHRNGGALKGLVLDLRNNPGGVLHGAVEVSDAFLESGLIVSIRGRHADANHSFHATADDLIEDAPIVVLVNGGSASAAEIVAGALQDHKRAIIMGTRTFGKGSVQSVIPVNNGGALKLTTARHYTPSNRSIQARGIAPDIVVAAGAPATAPQAQREVRESNLAGHLENDRAGETAANHETGAGLAARDYQVGEALNLLKGMSLVRLRGQGADTNVDSAQPASGEG